MTEHSYSKEIDALRKDLGRLQSDLQSLTRAFADDARLTAWGAVHQASEQAGELAHRTGQAYRSGVDEVQHEISRHPMASLLTAAGLGFVVGSLARR
ncbi:MAG: DUF883 family protein [bacterium]